MLSDGPTTLNTAAAGDAVGCTVDVGLAVFVGETVTMDASVVDFLGERVGCWEGRRIELKGAGLILPGLRGPPWEARPVAKGSVTFRRGGMLGERVAGDSGDSAGCASIGGSGLPGIPGFAPMPGRGLVAWNGAGSGLVVCSGGGSGRIFGSCGGSGLDICIGVGSGPTVVETGLGFGVSTSSVPIFSCDDCGVPFLGHSFLPTGAFPFPLSGSADFTWSGRSGIRVGPKSCGWRDGSTAGRSGMVTEEGPPLPPRALPACRETNPPLTGGRILGASSRSGGTGC